MAANSLSDDERRVLGLIAALVILGAGARWLERPREILPDVPALDLAALEAASREAKEGGGATGGGTGARPGRPLDPNTAPLDPNTATAKELDALPGVGAAVAGRIIEAREQAPFRTTGDLTRVRGIGPATVAKWDGLLALPAGPPSDSPTGAAPTGGASTGGAPTGGAPTGGAPTGVASTDGAPTGGSRGDDLVGPASSGAAAPVSISLNSASEQELQQIRGIGPALARRIIARRDSLRHFKNWEQVDSIRGIGPALLATLQQRAILR